MRLAYSTLACPRWTVEEAVAAAIRYGHDAIEWRLADGAIIDADTPLAVRRRIREVPAANGIAFACLDTSYRLVQASPEECVAVTERVQRMIDMADELGAPLLRVFGGSLPPGTTQLDLVHFQHPRISDTFASISGINLSPVWCYPILIGNGTPEFSATFDH